MIQQKVGIPITIFIGTEYDSNNVRIALGERGGIRHKILTKAVEQFGGATILNTKGAWVDDAGKVIEEKGFQLVIYTWRQDGSYRPKLNRLLRFILAVGRQASILVDDRASPEAYLAFSDSSGTNGVKEHD